MNKIDVEFSNSMDRHREEEAVRDYPRYKKGSKEWTWLVKGTRKYALEISVIRRGNRHGHISYGWGCPDNKIIIHDADTDVTPKFIYDRMVLLAKECAQILNNK